MAGPGGVEVGRVSVKVVPDTTDFGRDLLKTLQALEKSSKLTIGADLDADQLVASASRAVKAAQSTAGDIQVDMNVDLDNAQLAELGARLKSSTKSLAKINLDPEVDPAKLQAKLNAAIAAAEAATRDINITADMDVDGSGLAGAARRAVAMAQRVAGKISVKMDVDKSSAAAMTALTAVGGVATGVMSAFGAAGAMAAKGLLVLPSVIMAVVAAASALVAPLAAGAASLAGMAMSVGAVAVPAVAALGLGIGVLITAFSGLGDAINAEDPEAYAAALEELSPSAREAVGSLRELKEQFAGIGDEVQESFFANISNLGDLSAPIEALRGPMTGLAMEMGNAAAGLVAFVSSGTGLDQFGQLMEGASFAGAELSYALTAVLQALIPIGAAAAPLFTAMASGLREMAEGWSANISSMAESGELFLKLRDGVDSIKALGAGLGELWGILSGVVGAAATAGSAFGSFGVALSSVNDWVNSIAGQTALVDFFTSMNSIVTALMPVFGELASVIGTTVAPAIADFVVAMGPGLEAAMSGFTAAMEILAPLMPELGAAFSDILVALAPVLPLMAELAVAVLPGLAEVLLLAVEGFVALLGALRPILPYIAIAVGAFMLMSSPILLIIIAVGLLVAGLMAAWPAIVSFATGVGTWFANMWTSVSSTVSAMVSGVISWFANLWSSITSGVSAGVSAVVSFFSNLGSSISSTVSAMVSAVVSFFSNMWSSAVSMVSSMVSSIVSFFVGLASSVISSAISMWQGFSSAVSSGISTAMGFITGLPGRVMSVLGNLGGLLVGSGKALIQGFINGIKSMVGAIADAARGAVQAARDFFPFSPAKKGPFSGKGWVLYAGRSIGEAFADGLDDRAPLAADAANRLLGGVSGNLNGYRADVTAARTGTGAGQLAGVGADYSVTIGTIVAADERAPLREAAQLQLKAKIKGGTI